MKSFGLECEVKIALSNGPQGDQPDGDPSLEGYTVVWKAWGRGRGTADDIHGAEQVHKIYLKLGPMRSFSLSEIQSIVGHSYFS